MIGFFIKYWQLVLGAVALALVFGWYQVKVSNAYKSGWELGRANLQQAYLAEQNDNKNIIDKGAVVLETIKTVTKTKFVPVERLVYEYVSTPSKESCETQYINSDKPFDPEFLRVLNAVAAGSYVPSEPVKPVPGPTP